MSVPKNDSGVLVGVIGCCMLVGGLIGGATIFAGEVDQYSQRRTFFLSFSATLSLSSSY